MNFEHLKVFHTVAREKSFSKTAKILHMSQPAISLQIRQLEESLNTKLFKRTTRKVDLTQAGEILFQSAEKIFYIVHQTEKDITLLSNSIHGVLHIGASLTMGEHILPQVIGNFKREFPNVQILLDINNSEQVIEKLINEKIHIGFVQSMINYPEYRQRIFFEDELIIIAANDFSLQDSMELGNSLTLEDIYTLPFVFRESGSGTRQLFEEQLIKNNIDPSKLHVILELDNTQSIKSAVEAGIGISIISKASVQHELSLKTIRQLTIQGLNLKRYFYSVYDEKKLTPAGETFLSFIHYEL
ncbi:selenium metabolism-associated LysR family transcriptional regulator [Neobacillus mesonae]|uniref:selenium metabolism-associated LysR family transcriptional regulator n=1 Tax=Neobacillus mesonae TaxID=1193713 RepID=UPI0020409B52|nr:selenium metabolism-associated LysR family transcriptional regulator [Neobacillus mesonae]MCM3568048.1 selenium metabolism-associated LysR family transcriptional regulator [Neobacillus mesonae]